MNFEMFSSRFNTKVLVSKRVIFFGSIVLINKIKRFEIISKLLGICSTEKRINCSKVYWSPAIEFKFNELMKVYNLNGI